MKKKKFSKYFSIKIQKTILQGCLNIIENESSLILLLSWTNPGTLKPAGFLEHEIKISKNLASDKTHREKSLKDYVTLQLLE